MEWTRRTNGLLSRPERASPHQRCRAAAEAITLHVNPAVAPEQGAEAHLMHDGVLLDAVGLRAWELRAEAIELVRSRQRQPYGNGARLVGVRSLPAGMA